MSWYTVKQLHSDSNILLWMNKTYIYFLYIDMPPYIFAFQQLVGLLVIYQIAAYGSLIYVGIFGNI